MRPNKTKEIAECKNSADLKQELGKPRNNISHKAEGLSLFFSAFFLCVVATPNAFVTLEVSAC